MAALVLANFWLRIKLLRYVALYQEKLSERRDGKRNYLKAFLQISPENMHVTIEPSGGIV